MKSILKITVLLIVCQLTACQEDEKNKPDLKTEMLTATSWGHAQVTHSDGDLSGQYTDFSISFTSNSSNGFDGTFSISNGSYAFEETTGKWKFNDDQDQIMFDSEKVMDIHLEENHLQLDFTVAEPGGKISGVSGHFTFDLQPL
jgi:hypothetical protein